jgi:hypothetical protein
MLETLHKYVKQGWLAPAGGPPPRRAAMVSVSQGGHLKSFDTMLLLEGGSVVASGTREELLASGNELAARLLRASAAGNGSLDDAGPTAAEEANAAPKDADTPDETLPPSVGGTMAVVAGKGTAPVAKAALPVSGVSRLTTTESKRAGSFSLGLYSTYIRALGRINTSIYILLLFVTYAAYLWFDLWLIRWIRDDEACGSSLGSPPTNPDCGRPSSSTNALIYASLGVGHVIALITTSVFLTAISVRASMSMHRDTISRVLYAPVSWYDATPSGRVLSRFTSDLNTVDVKLSMDIDNLLQMVRPAQCFLLVSRRGGTAGQNFWPVPPPLSIISLRPHPARPPARPLSPQRHTSSLHPCPPPPRYSWWALW